MEQVVQIPHRQSWKPCQYPPIWDDILLPRRHGQLIGNETFESTDRQPIK
jgi:hypothetical protein